MTTEQRQAAPDTVGRATIVVQHTLAPPDGTTKYVDQIADGVPQDVHIRYFSWRRAIFGRYDIFHAHWPELMIRGNGRLRRFFKRRAMELLIVRLRTRRIPLVRTLHNVTPHELGPDSECRSLSRFDRAVDLFVRLNPFTEPPTSAETVTILHGHYVHRFADHPLPDRQPGRILYFGIIRKYKGVDRLLDAFRELDDDKLTLRVVGSPSVGQRDVVQTRCALDERTSALLRYVDDAELADEIGRAELVVLPYRDMHNSGSVILALSLARPALVPRSPANTALSHEVGPGWILQYDGELGASHIATALATVRNTPPGCTPDLSERDWVHIGEQHRLAYEGALRRMRSQ